MTVHGKVVVVTGAGSGIGLETARILVARGAQVGIVCRTAETAATACESIAAPPGRVETFVADLSAQAAVRRLADTIVRRYPRVDVLINNAAAIYSRPVLSDDGIEMQLAVNHLAGYLLARLHLEHLRAGEHDDAFLAVASGRYEWIGRLLSATLHNPKVGQIGLTGRLDRFATHPYWGFLILAGMLGLIFWMTFTIGSPLQGWLESTLVTRT